MRSGKRLAFVCGLVAVSFSPHANANAFSFGRSGSSDAVNLILNGDITLDTTNTGWYNQAGLHEATNQNYIVGTCTTICTNGPNFRDFFVFYIPQISAPITSAVLSIIQPINGYDGPTGGLVYRIGAVDASVSSLIAPQTNAVVLYNALAAGLQLADSTLITSLSEGEHVTLSLNVAGLAAITQSEGQLLAFGGSIGPTVITTPLPGSWALMLTCLIGVGLIIYRRKIVSAG